MTTLKELGLTISGNNLIGDKNNITLNVLGAEELNRKYLPMGDHRFNAGDFVIVKERLAPDQKRGDIVAGAMIGESNYIVPVSVESDNWFCREK